MKKNILVFFIVPVFALSVRAQQVFDSAQFNKNLEFANWLAEYEYFTELGTEEITKDPENPVSEWFSYKENNYWHVICGNFADDTFRIIKHVIIDTLYNISEYSGKADTSRLNSAGSALIKAETHFQLIRDTSNMYFTSFLYRNPDQTISVWYFPAFQPSGQAIYGCEWEYVFDSSGRDILKQYSYSNNITAVWVGQPRELWLNYRNTDNPTVGSLFFVQSFRDYFTRIRIDTRISTSTTAKDSNGNYSWTHKMK